MDIVTHTLMGAALAAPFIESQPLIASGILMGSVLPDIDSLGRIFGKKFFLRHHQVWSHSIFSAFLVGTSLSLFFLYLDFPPWESWSGGIALSLGMLLHNFCDYSNTFGIALFHPFSRKRYCREWIFFIDIIVLFLSVVSLAFTYLGYYKAGYFYAFSLALYWLFRAWLRKKAEQEVFEPVLGLIPTAFFPWIFLGTRVKEGRVEIFEFDVWKKEEYKREIKEIFDAQFLAPLAEVPEFQVMRNLSSAYHLVVVESTPEKTYLKCQDLRTRNFNTSFGSLELWLDKEGKLLRKEFYV